MEVGGLSEDIFEIAMPRLGTAMTEGTIVAWHKAVGDTVVEGEALLTIESEKVEVDVPSPLGGVVAELLAEEGDVIPILVPIARIRAT
jgi:2-oxoglutarate dehydrogenase E2 component (dihydrolipoamide succinyltransferase)